MNDPILFKGIVLILAILAGAMCIFLGYRLYSQGVRERGHLQAEGHGFTVVLKNYGPGVVLAFFGAALICFAVTRDLRTESHTYFSDGSSTADMAHGASVYQRLDVATGAGPDAVAPKASSAAPSPPTR